MSNRFATLLSLSLAVALLLPVAASVPSAAQGPPPPTNVVTISIVQNEIKVKNRGVGLCKAEQEEVDCKSRIVWKWTGGDPNEDETEKIVISYVKGTNEAYDCFQDASGNPKLYFEIRERNSEVEAAVTAACPAKSAWLYQISCVRTDPGFEDELCTGIAPVDPGAVIG